MMRGSLGCVDEKPRGWYTHDFEREESMLLEEWVHFSLNVTLIEDKHCIRFSYRVNMLLLTLGGR